MNYIILSPKHGTADNPVFWKANNAGYTNSPFNAGIYTSEQIEAEPDYYNDGVTAVAIPLTDAAMHDLGFGCYYDEKKVNQFLQCDREIARGIKRHK